MMGTYDVAQICPNGHLVTQFAGTSPAAREDFCSQCGEPTIMACPKCARPIRGDYHVDGVIGFGGYDMPAHCFACGAPFPWTERKILAAIELATEVGGLAGEDAEKFKDAAENIVKSTPRSELAAARMKGFILKSSKPVGESMRNLLVDITAESIKRTVWGDSTTAKK